MGRRKDRKEGGREEEKNSEVVRGTREREFGKEGSKEEGRKEGKKRGRGRR